MRADLEMKKGIPGFREDRSSLIYFAGCRYWTASLLPALVGMTLPFWLCPPHFAFRWIAGVEFLVATALCHSGFAFLQARFEGRSAPGWTPHRLLGAGSACIGAACLLGLHLHAGLKPHASVPGYIFLVYGVAALIAGALYVAPPPHFCRRAGGEIVLAEGLGLVPVVGAYLVQVGDLTRTVYIAAIPLVAATWLWVWTDELVTRSDDEQSGRGTLVIEFGARLSGRFITPVSALAIYASLLGAVILRHSLPPLGLTAGISLGFAWKAARISCHGYADPTRMRSARRNAFLVHFVIGVLLAAASLVTPGGPGR